MPNVCLVEIDYVASNALVDFGQDSFSDFFTESLILAQDERWRRA